MWFGVRLLMECRVEARSLDEPLFAARIIVVKASTETGARAKAKRFDRAAQERYVNAEGTTVQWVLREMLDVKALFDEVIADGSEVYYAFLRQTDVERVRQSLQPGQEGSIALEAVADRWLGFPIASGSSPLPLGGREGEGSAFTASNEFSLPLGEG
jgi:hypothetical protein